MSLRWIFQMLYNSKGQEYIWSVMFEIFAVQSIYLILFSLIMTFEMILTFSKVMISPSPYVVVKVNCWQLNSFVGIPHRFLPSEVSLLVWGWWWGEMVDVSDWSSLQTLLIIDQEPGNCYVCCLELVMGIKFKGKWVNN